MEAYNFDNHQNKCRFCFKTLNKRYKHVTITDDIENKFYSMTNIHLKSSLIFSKQICVNCDKNLSSFDQFKTNLVERQLKLYEAFSDEAEEFQEVEVPLDLVKVEAFRLDPAELVETKQKMKTKAIPHQEHLKTSTAKPKKRAKIQETQEEINRKKSLKRVGLCPECGKYVSEVARHLRRKHSKMIRFFCDICNYGSIEKSYFIVHMKKHRPKEEREKFKCRHCDFTTVDRGYLRNVHEKTHIGTRYHCDCGKSFLTKYILAQHVQVVHERVINFQCDFCPSGYNSKWNLKEHVLTQHTKKDIRDIVCSVCSKTFITKLRLSQHFKELHTEGTIPCSFEGCTRKFHKMSRLESHMLIHTKEKRYKCDKCDGFFRDLSQLYRHDETFHQGLRFHCEVTGCGMEFCRRENVRLHLSKSHQKIKPKDLELLLKRLKESKPR